MSQSRSGLMQPWLRLSTVLLLASVGLHGIVLSLPLPETDEPELSSEVEAETPAIDVVALPASQPQKAAANPPVPEPTRPPKPPTPLAQPAPSIPQPVASPVPTPSPTSDPPVSEPEPELEPEVPAEPAPVDPFMNPDSYVYNGKASSTDNGRDEITNWTINITMQGIAFEKLTEPVITVAYPLSNCLPRQPVEGSLGVVVAADGQTDQETLGSTGYPILDNRALELLETINLPAVDQSKAYLLSVVVQYDEASCTP